MLKKTKKVLLRAPLLSHSGYGVHARQIARWLFDKEKDLDLEITTELLNWGHTSWITDIDAENGLVKKILNANTPYEAKAGARPFDVTIQLQLPNEWNPTLGAYNVGITAGVEATLCHPRWIDNCNTMSLVVVPSEFTKGVFTATAARTNKPLTTPVQVVPEAFPDVFLSGQRNPRSDVSLALDKLPGAFNLLFVGQITATDVELDRKNMYRMMVLLNQVFSGHKDVGLILKTSFVTQSVRDREVTHNLLNQAIAGLNIKGNPKATLLHGSLSDAEMLDLYTHPKVSGLVSLTHGEGFGLPLLEAAAAGLPVMATNWSAHTEFLNAGPKWLPIAHQLRTIPEKKADGQIWIGGSEWADINDHDFGVKMKKFYDSPSLPRQWAKDGASKLKALYSFSAISKRYDSVIGKALGVVE
jgi:glycosyltransferase involved in cell wall biosynthesis